MVIMMNVSFRQIILLYCLQKLNGERTIYSIYHLLQGKKSSQTIQDAHLFQLSAFFHTDTNITRQQIADHAHELKRNSLIAETLDQHFILTAEGERVLKRGLSISPVPSYLNGWKYGRAGLLLWERLSLAVQVLSHLQHRETKYIPVQRRPETLLWVKEFVQTYGLNRKDLSENLYTELTSLLESGLNIDPNLLVVRLSGCGRIGLTEIQAAQEMKMDPVHYHYQFLNIIHYLALRIEEDHFPIMSAFLERETDILLTKSTEKTYTLLKDGHSLDDIIHIRRLKPSTIEDHIVELALNIPQFSIAEYVNAKKQRQIKEAIKAANTKQLREIRKYAPEASYFEIRIVLAKFGDNS
ncbi:helix-turn-helix domain-containing protein [Bacillus benzoevorans]|nr:helix-turn-helix domain-containing protein [Bacillus benzoevorans]